MLYFFLFVALFTLVYPRVMGCLFASIAVVIVAAIVIWLVICLIDYAWHAAGLAPLSWSIFTH